jgi:cyclophilin family peptidyl-prolyl cis-trans isomerase
MIMEGQQGMIDAGPNEGGSVFYLKFPKARVIENNVKRQA